MRHQSAFGVVLNRNAGRVTHGLTRRVRHLVGDDHVFLTESPEHADEVLQVCLERGYGAVFSGGGDGTAIDTINTLERYRGQTPLPAVGVLRLGTGNALARWLGSKRPERDLARYIRGDVGTTVQVRMLWSENTLFPFGGLGYDAAVLNDYYTWKKRFMGTRLQGLFSGLSGYFLAGFGKTIPRFLRRPKQLMEVVNLGDTAWRISPGGDRAEAVPHGGVLYNGPASFVGAATTPLLGYGVRLFPFADRRTDRFHLRLLDMNPFQCAWSLPAGWRGTLQGPGVHDFYADRVRIRFEDATPLQLAGDPKGYRSEVDFALAAQAIPMIASA